MIRAGVLALVASCGTPATHSSSPVEPKPPPATPDAWVPVGPPPPSAEVVHPDNRAAIEAPSAGAIVALAVTADGGAAVTADGLGGMRLWPALDGSREPLVVDLPNPRDLAIGRRGDDFTIVVRDDVGGLIVAHVDKNGRTQSHAALPAEPAYVGMEMSSEGLVAWRSDQTIERIGNDGRIASRLAAEAGQRIADVSVSGARGVALIEASGTRRARVFDIGPKLAWGSWLGASTELGRQIALSPTGARYATISRNEAKSFARIVVLDVKGAVIGEHQYNNVGEVAQIEFIDDDHVAVAGPSALVWMTFKAGKVDVAPAAGPLTQAPDGHILLGVGGGHAFATNGGDIAVATPASIAYLGYGVESPTIAQPGPENRLVVGVADQYVTLDKDLLAASSPQLPVPAGATMADIRWLGGDDWLTVYSGSDGVTRVALVNAASGTSKVVRDHLAVVPVVMYEQTTHLLTLSFGDTPEVDRYDAEHHAIDKVAALPKPKGYEQVELVPVSPARADGVELLRVGVREKPKLSWLKDPKKLDGAATSVSIENASFAGADAAGHAYVWRNTEKNTLELAVYRNGKALATLPTDGPVALWPDTTGERVVEVGQRSVALYKLDGKRVWIQELAGTTEALWLGDSSIAIVSAAGIARLDAATGQVTAARCGWKFGLAAKPHPPTPQIEPVCVQLER